MENVTDKDESQSACKRNAILSAATEIFLSVGFEAASMDTIATLADVSKQTIYNHFGSKQALFNAIIDERCRHFVKPLVSARARAQGIKAVLTELARQSTRLMLTPSSLALYRLLMAETSRFPDLGCQAYKLGAEQAVSALAQYLAEQQELGVIEVGDVRLAAEQFLGMLAGHIHLRALLGVEPQPDAERLERSIAQTVHTFLRTYGTGGSQEAG